MANYCLDCKHFIVDDRDLVAGQLLPKYKFKVECYKHQLSYTHQLWPFSNVKKWGCIHQYRKLLPNL